MPIKEYTIKKAYPGNYSDKYNEVEITSEGLYYSEIGEHHTGCQVSNLDNQKLIHEKCNQISKLIKEIDQLNK